ncbi:uncharacterized protein LOC126271862 [Schistocerca gregaria]|uniref:uncharacterized protein LOC126271862 n=1 Tax=Schistocerca gregaria TaxID=7010 RepID=UPI00211E39F7|nr:uncharacterized protein LOC126271862 [Schistocerca gregaria]XP_049830157.1 uncharacterized protein LOC126271862 [Schistocerca gregaria]
MGSIISLTKTDENQDFSTEGVTKGVEDDIPDDDCILSEKRFNIDTLSILDKVCDRSVNGDNSFMMNKEVIDIKEKSLSDCVTAGQQSADHVSDVSTVCVPAAANLVDRDINNKNMVGETNDKHGKSFPNKQDNLPKSGFDNTDKKCQIKEGSCKYPHKASGEKVSQIRPDVLKEQSELYPNAMITDERVDCSHNGTGKNNENHVYKRSAVIEALMNILSRNQNQLENKMPAAGAVTTNVKSQTVPSTVTLSSNTKTRKLDKSLMTPDRLVLDAGQVRKQLKSGVERVLLHLEKLKEALNILPFNNDNSFELTASESLKNQINGMTTAVTQMYHIVYNTPQKDLSFLDILYQMATQLSKAEEEILKIRDTTEDSVTYLLHFQKTLDSLRDGDMKAEDRISH